MSQFATLQQQLVAALKSKDETRLSTLRTLKAAIQKAAIDSKQSADDDVLAVTVFKQEAKKRHDSIQAYTQGGRLDLAEKEQAELAVIEQFLPAQMTEEAIRTELQQLVAQAENKNFGVVMKQAMQQLHGRADGQQVATILKQLLAI